jgi:serine/threonine protein kinase
VSDSQPPDITGFSHVGWLGGGGFADVFLYEQHFPQRQVAVKVLREGVDNPEVRALFESEANLMAKVAEHSFIVTVHAVGTSAQGRPYLVMDYFQGSNYGQRMKSGVIDVAEVLSVGVKMAGAVEFAHRAGVVHRDIKPANILANRFGEPGLADFGISAAHTDSATHESVGFSPAYAPREVLVNDNPGDRLSDVYSLAATLWAMLEGHAPYEVPGGRNGNADITHRTLNSTPPPMRRSVPPTLELLLRQALSHDRSERPSSAASFGMALQSVETGLGYRPTNLPLPQELLAKPIDDGLDRTRQGAGIVVSPQAAPPPPPSAMITGVATGEARSATPRVPLSAPAPLPAPADPNTVRGNRSVPPPPAGPTAAVAEPANPRGTRLALIGGAVAALLVVIVVAVVALGGDESTADTTTTSIEDDGFEPNTDVLPTAVTGLTVVLDGDGYLVSWATQAAAVDEYVVLPDAGATSFPSVRTPELAVRLDDPELVAAAADFGLCVAVTARNSAGESSAVESCVAAP